MPFKDVSKRKEYRKKWYQENKISELAHVKRRKLSIRKWYQERKNGLSCKICKENHPAVIDFHHSGKDKDNEVSFMVFNGYSINLIEKEVSKCEILCSNCHRKEHYQNSNF